MAPVLIFMAVVVGVAVLALVYAAYPHRGHPVPGAPWKHRVPWPRRRSASMMRGTSKRVSTLSRSRS